MTELDLAGFAGALGGVARRALADVAGPVLDPYSRVGLAALACACVIAAIVHARRMAAGKRFRLRDFLAYLVPKAVYGHPSARLDLKVYLFTMLGKPAGLLLFGVTVAGASAAVADVLAQILGPRGAPFGAGPAAYAALALALVLAFDFSSYVTHRLSHEIPALWAFHRVHHSADVLTPLTLHRKHPLYDALSALMDVALVAPLQGAIIYLWGVPTTNAAIAGLAIAFGVFAWAAGALRHSHVWLSFGPVGDRIVISPAAHQIHHSTAERHWNRNYGELLAVWDLMFGTACRPGRPETLQFGLGGAEGGRAPQPHPTLVAAMFEPFTYAWRGVARRGRADAEPGVEAETA